MKLYNEMNKNLLYFGNEKKPNSQVLFLFSFSFRVFVITVIQMKNKQKYYLIISFFQFPKYGKF